MDRLQRRLRLIAALIGVSAMTGEVAAGTIRVPGDKPTIQSAIDHAAAGDEIIVGVRTYSENLKIAKSLTLRSAYGYPATRIQGDGTSAVVSISGAGIDVSIQGFAISNGSGVPVGAVVSGGGISVRVARSVRILENDIVGNGVKKSLEGQGGGIYAAQCPDLLIARNRIHGNSAYLGAGVSIELCPGFRITDNEIYLNGIENGAYGGGVLVRADSPGTIDLNRIHGNRAQLFGGGINLWSSVTVVNNCIFENTSNKGGGIYLYRDTVGAQEFSIIHNTIAKNEAVRAGAGILADADGATVTVHGNILWGNRLGTTPSNLSILSDSPPEPLPFGIVAYNDIESLATVETGWWDAGSLVPAPFGTNFSEAPEFVDPAHDTCHILSSSPAVDAAPPRAGLVVDIDKETRDARPDVGADEIVGIIPPPLLLGCEVSAEGDDVTVTWQNKGTYHWVAVMRDGAEIARLSGTATYYADVNVAIGVHVYAVVALVSGDSFASGTCTITVAPSPPVLKPPAIGRCEVKNLVDVEIVWSNLDTYNYVRVLRGETMLVLLPGHATGYVDFGLAAGTYSYTVVGIAGSTSASSKPCTVTVTPGPAPLRAPELVACEVKDGDDVRLEWYNWDIYDSVRVTRDGVEIAALSGSSISYTDWNVSAGSHTYAVTGIAGARSTTSASCTIAISTGQTSPRIVRCAAIAGDNVAIAWENRASYAYVDIVRDGQMIARLPGTSTQFTVEGLRAGVFQFIVKGIVGSDAFASAPCTVIVPVEPPSSVTCAPVPGDGVRISWIRDDDPYTEIAVFRDSGSGPDQIAVLVGSAASYLDAGVGAGTHAYHLVAFVGVIASVPSGVCETASGLACPWFNAAWSYRKELTIDHARVAGGLTNFPVAVVFASDIDLAAKARDDGRDIVFTDAGHRRLQHEIERFDGLTGALVAWVKVPGVYASIDTVLYMYYGNISPSGGGDPTAVWDPHYMGVWHLDEQQTGTGGPGLYRDSTCNANHGDDLVSDMGKDGVLGRGQAFDGNDGVLVPHDPSLNLKGSWTLSVWACTAYIERGSRCLISKEDGPRPPSLFHQNDGKIQLSYGPDASVLHLVTDVKIAANTWHHIAATYDGTLTIYLDGKKQVSKMQEAPPRNENPIIFGYENDHSYGFTGRMDEIRISNTARSAEWIQTSYNSQKDPASFLKRGAEELVGTICTAQRSPQILGCRITDPQRVEVTWRNPQAYDAIRVFRGGTQVALLSGDATQYADLIVPEGIAEYTVVGIAGGEAFPSLVCAVTIAPLWFDCAWSYRKQIWINHVLVYGDFTQFPVLVSFDSDADLAARAADDGRDLVFTDVHGMLLDFEIDHFDGVTGNLIAWVKVPIVLASQDARLYLYYGNPDATGLQNREGVWDVGYRLVWHMNDEASRTKIEDSTSFGFHASKQGAGGPTEIEGKIGMGQSFQNSCLATAACVPGGHANLVVSAWVKLNTVGTVQTIIDHATRELPIFRFFFSPEPCVGQPGYCWDPLYFNVNIEGRTTPYGFCTPYVNVVPGVWYQVVAYLHGGEFGIYVNGVWQGRGGVPGGGLRTGCLPIRVGCTLRNDGGDHFDGVIDEVQISTIARSGAWIQTSFFNQDMPDVFLRRAQEETAVFGCAKPPQAPRIASCAAAGADAVLVSWENLDAYDSIRVLRDGVQIAVLPPEATTYTDAGALAGSFRYTVVAVAGGTQIASAQCTASVPIEPPRNLVCTALAAGGASISWTNDDPYTEIQVFRNSARIATLPGTATSYTDTALSAGSYSYAVVALVGSQSASSAACAVTISPPALNPPVITSCSASAGGAVTIVWQTTSSYDLIKVKRDGVAIAELPGTATQYTDSSVSSGTFQYIVVGVRGAQTAASGPCTVTVSVSVEPPSGLTCIYVGGDIRMFWTNNGAYTKIQIFRDGARIADLSGTATSYVDKPGPGLFTYHLVAWVSSLSSDASGSCVIDPPPGSAAFIRGDFNLDSHLDIGDAIAILAHLFPSGPVEVAPLCLDAADGNDDGAIDIGDAIAVLAYLFSGGRPLPSPHLACGPDPTEDGVTCTSFDPCP